jgi:uncharacterized FlaG/YvyC family protein
METGNIESVGVKSGEIAASTSAVNNTNVKKVELAKPEPTDAVQIKLSSTASAVISRESEAKASAPKTERPTVRDSQAGVREQLETVRSEFEGKVNDTQVQFDVTIEGDGSTGMFFQVVDKNTGKVIRQFPPEELVDLGKAVEEVTSSASKLATRIDASA